jgi:hypothetical protein
MSYRVVRFFTDLKDNNHAYHPGDTFPREGMTASDERLKELSSDKNLQHKILIKEVPEDVTETVEESEKSPKKSKKRSK